MNTQQENKYWNSKPTVDEFQGLKFSSYWNNILDSVDNPQEKTALDLGCGGGRHTELIYSKGFHTSACDFHSQMALATKTRIENKFTTQVTSGEIAQANMIALPYQRDYFDLVLANGILHNAFNTEEFVSAVKEVSRVLKRGGVFLLNVFTSDHINTGLLALTNTPNVYLTNEGLRMTLLNAEIILDLFANSNLVPVGEVQRYISEVSTGERSILRTVLKKY